MSCVLKAISFLLLVLVCATTPASGATVTVAIKANATKPLSLTAVQDLDLGTIILNAGTWSGVSVGISRTGILNCGTSQVVCLGSAQVAKYSVTGQSKQQINITAPDVILTNQSDPSKTLRMIVDSPGTIVLSNSGNKGEEFALGGSISVSSSTVGGQYKGTFNVTVDY